MSAALAELEVRRCPGTRYEWWEQSKCGNPTARFLLYTLVLELGMATGIADSPESINGLMRDMEASEHQVRSAIRQLVRRGLLEPSDRVEILTGQYVTGWRLAYREPEEPPRPASELELKRAAFKRSAVRRALRAEIAAGLHRCPCGRADQLTVDHIVPLARGGTNQRENLQVLCLSCNTSKGARVL